MDQQVDLFGNPYDASGRKQGRPEHQPTEASVINVMVLVACGQSNKEISSTVGLDVKTLKRHYGHILKQRAVMLDRLRSKLRTEQIRLGLSGNAAALANAIKMLDAVSAERIARQMQDRAANQSGARNYVSKKEQRLESAKKIGVSGGKYATPTPPRLVANNGQAIDADRDT